MRKAIVTLVLSFAGAVSASAQSLPPPPAAGKCIGVMSVLGDKFTLRKVGVMVFGNENNVLPVNWSNIDDLAAAKVTAFIGKRASVRRLTYSKSAVAAWDTPGGGLFRRPAEEFRELVRVAAAPHRCDQNVVAVRTVQPVTGTNQSIFGLGMIEMGAPINPRVFLYAAFSIAVYDGRTFELVRSHKVVREDPLVAHLFSNLGGTARQVDRSWWPDPAKVAQDARLRDAMRSLVDQGLTATLPRAFPPPGS